MRLLHMLVLILLLHQLTAAEEAWILSGQSNMAGGSGTYAAALKSLVTEQGGTFCLLAASAPGKPIEAWLDPDHQDHRLWTELVDQVEKARQVGAHFKGFVWYQGESNVAHPWTYAAQLTELITRIRTISATPDLPVIVVQLAAHVGYSPENGWNTGIVREMMRRVAENDARVTLVAAMDCEVGDYTVHVSGAGHAVLAKRIVAAARHLAYAGPDHGWGPRFLRAYVDAASPRVVMVEFAGVQSGLSLRPGWRQAFALHRQQAPLPDPLPQTTTLISLHDDYDNPIGAQVIKDRYLALRFATDVPVGSALSYGAAANAQIGAHRSWGLEIDGLSDASTAQAWAFVLQTVQARPADAVVGDAKAATGSERRFTLEEPFQVGVNCIGRFPPAVMPPDTEAGVAEWRQAWWNPVSAGQVRDLFDSQGRTGSVFFTTSVWYMSPHFKNIDDPDRQLMAGWCRSTTHQIGGLKPGAAYDVAIYALARDDKDPPATDPATDGLIRIRVSTVDPSSRGKPKLITAVDRTIQTPFGSSFTSLAVATEANGWRGCVLIAEAFVAGADGSIVLDLGKATLSAVQIRRNK